MYKFRRRHKAISTLIFIAGLIYVVATQSGWLKSTAKTVQKSDPGLYSINHFVDGDTIAVDMNGSVETVRMIGVDTPETHKPNTPVQCYGPEAAAYTKQLIGQSKVRLQADQLDTNRDRYNRLLRYVYLPDGRMNSKTASRPLRPPKKAYGPPVPLPLKPTAASKPIIAKSL
jgi:endonuclease YncB( thermonuclease family)